jgi:hypothetical protein
MPLSKNASASKWIHDFVHSKNKKFKGDDKKKRIDRALGAYYGKQNEEMQFDELRDAHIQEGLSRMFDRIGDVDVSEVGRVEEEVQNEVEEDNREKLREVAEKAHTLYRSKIKPKPEKVEDEPDKGAHIKLRPSFVSSVIAPSRGGSEGKTSLPAGPNGGSTGGLGHSINTGLYPTTLTMEEYEEYISNRFKELKEDEVQEIIEEYAPLEKTEDPLSVAVLKLQESILNLTDTSWQYVDVELRRVCNEEEMLPKDLYKGFRKITGMIPEEWARKNRVQEECGMIPLDEVSRIQETGQVYDISCIFKGSTQRLKFFWPSISRPTKSQMEAEVQKFYPGSRLIAYYPVQDSQTIGNCSVMLAPKFENYIVYQEDDWGFMSEEATEIYNEICNEEGHPMCPPYLVEENVYEMEIEDYDTGENRRVQFEERGERGVGKSFLKEIKE